MAPDTRDPAPRLAELIAALSLATDLGLGQPLEHALRTCLLAIRIGDLAGLTEADLGDVYYAALLRRIGCTADSFELGRIFGDDLAAHSRTFAIDLSRPLDLVADLIRYAGADRPLPDRLRTLAGALAAGPSMPASVFRASCEVAQSLAAQLGFGPVILEILGQTFERWDGRGFPGRVAGEAIALPARVVQVAEEAEVYHRAGRRRGRAAGDAAAGRLGL